MRLMIFNLILAVAVAGGAAAQESGIARMVQMERENQPSQTEAKRSPYAEAMLALKTKLQRQTQADGGKLTPEHQAAIQTELDAINGKYGKVAKR